MKTNSWRILLVISLTAWLAVPACGQMSKGDGSESHFVECHTDADCRDGGETALCTSGKCVPPTTDAGVPCYPVLARKYDGAQDCYAPKAPIPGLCLRESEPKTTAGTGEIACLAAPDGSRYAVVKGYTQCLEVDGSPAPIGTAGGWTVKGDTGLCESSPELVAADGGVAIDHACAAAISRGRWILGPFIPELDFRGSGSASDGGTPASDGGANAVECR